MAAKKIALVYDAIYPYVKGGAERRFYELGKRLAAQGYDIHLYGMKLWDGPEVVYRDGMTLHGIAKARPLYTKAGRRSIFQAVMFGLAAFKLIREDFDAIDCCGFPYFSMFPSKLVALIKGKPLHATWHEVWGYAYWQEYLGKMGLIGYLVEKLASMLPDTIIACSDLTASRLRDELKVKRPIRVVANGIDVQTMLDILPAQQTSTLVYVGRLIAHKNIDLLIRALAILKQQGQSVDCTIVGSGPEKESLQALAHRLGVSGQITWTGFIEASEDVYALIKAAKAFVLPSAREGFGIVALEANACGIPVLTLDHADNATRHLIQPGHNGAIFRHDPDALASSIATVLVDYGPRVQKQCQAFARAFDWSNLSRQLNKVYQS